MWANFARVGHSEHEFTIDFIRVDQNPSSDGTAQGIVTARVNVSPLFVTQLLEALQSNWNEFAKKAMPKEVQGEN